MIERLWIRLTVVIPDVDQDPLFIAHGKSESLLLNVPSNLMLPNSLIIEVAHGMEVKQNILCFGEAVLKLYDKFFGGRGVDFVFVTDLLRVVVKDYLEIPA